MSTITVQTISNGSVSTSSANVINGSAKAWVNFNGTGTVAIRASYNVSSITDNGTGDYTINLTNALADANYSCSISCGVNSSDGNYANQISLNSTNSAVNNYYQAPTSTTMRFIQRNSGFNFADPTHCYAVFFR